MSLEGRIAVRRAHTSQWQAASLNDTFCPEDRLRVEALSRAALLFEDHSVLRLDQGSAVIFPAAETSRPSWVELLRGALHFITRTPRALEVKTPYVRAAVEGTEFVVRVEPRQSWVWVLEGQVRASNPQGSLLLDSGEGALAEADRAPVRQLLVEPRDAVHWALYYPPLTDLLDPATASSDSALALALARAPNPATALALEAVMAVLDNQYRQALTRAAEAIEGAPDSPLPRIAQSYARQAAFDIDGALDSARRATRLAPEDALAWARVAELQLARGELDAALAAARHSITLDPELARGRTLLGFAHLSRLEPGQARSAFERALTLDSADPLTRLGLGLARIGAGDLAGGRQELEIAAALDPGQSLIRSYLGKAYFEEHRIPLAAGQLELAKALDPRDPSPWFYDALRKQLGNRPGEALTDLEAAIERNDQRAVYRSRLLLDEDLAVRSASLGRIYSDLGFDRLALQQAAGSVTLDPGQFAAHRFLADAYALLPRHEVAQASATLQSLLLAPTTPWPVQPRLSVTEQLEVIAGAGPAGGAFNEFTPLFRRDGHRLTASGIIGSQQSRGDELVLSGLHGRWSYSLGQFHWETDGFRDNNDASHDLYNGFVQYRVTPQLSVQAAGLRRHTEQGDLGFDFEIDNFSDVYRRELDKDRLRLGAHWAPAPGSDWLADLEWVDRQEEVHTTGLDLSLHSQGSRLETQYLFHSDSYSLIAGAGGYRSEGELDVSTTNFDQTVAVAQSLGNGYLYGHFQPSSHLLLTVGVSFDTLDSGYFERNILNPKLALRWTPNRHLQLRLASLQGVKRAIAFERTLEPTQLAGFVQYQDDSDGSLFRLDGIGIDARLAPGLYAGLEWYRRDLEVPVVIDPLRAFPTLDDVVFEDWEEHNRGAYLYWLPHPHWALTAEYRLEQFERAPRLMTTSLPLELETRKVPLFLHYFVPGGWSARLGVTRVEQEIERFAAPGGHDSDQEHFSVVDAALHYRLPDRQGLIALEGHNLLDETFRFQDDNFRSAEVRNRNIAFIPERVLMLRAVFGF